MTTNLKCTPVLAILLVPGATWMNAQSQDWRAPIQDRLEAKYTLTKASADKSDIVTAGAVLVLKKDNLVMVTTGIPNMVPNTYKDGRITQGLFGKLNRLPGVTGNRVFARDEKFWLEKVDIKNDGVVLEFLSDPFDDVRYKGTLRFPFPKGSPPPIDQIENLVGQVIAVDGANESAANTQPAPSAARPATPAEKAPEPIAPPPPPPADPVSISSGQTNDQVVSSFGQPKTIVRLGAKQIYYYQDLKVTFVNGKVADVQ
ncbi:MAG: hypothetical protein ABSF64_00675 [Bryobacteraceae bacterium]|jgi:hypothetical protein